MVGKSFGAALASILIFCAPSSAQDEKIIRVTSVAHDVFIKGYARANAICDALQPPPIYVDKPPWHGIVCSNVGSLWLDKRVTRRGAKCAGRKVKGIHVIYLPKAGYLGPDTIHFVVKFPAEDHGVAASVTVVPSKPGEPPAVPSDISAPRGDKPQLPGPLPSCTALVS